MSINDLNFLGHGLTEHLNVPVQKALSILRLCGDFIQFETVCSSQLKLMSCFSLLFRKPTNNELNFLLKPSCLVPQSVMHLSIYRQNKKNK